MAYYSQYYVMYWTLPSGTPTIVENLPTTDRSGSTAYHISDYGSVIFGLASGDGYDTYKSARWDNGALTMMVDMVHDISRGRPRLGIPRWCSADAQLIIGAPDYGAGLGYWTGGGTAAALAVPAPGGIDPIYTGARVRQMAAAGNMFIGVSGGTQATFWTSGVPTPLPNNVYEYSTPLAISADGTTILGQGYTSARSSIPSKYGYWKTSAPSVWKPFRANDGYHRAINADGTVIWWDGYGNPGPNGYYDNLNTLTGGYYGTYHEVTRVAGSTGQYAGWYAEDTFSPNPVSAGYAQFSGGVTRAVRVTGTTSVLLPIPAGATGSWVTGISGNGQIVSGFLDSASGRGPCYWDAAGTYHDLLVPAGWESADTTQVSRNGAVIRGSVYRSWYEPDPPPAPIELRLVALEPQDLPANTFSIFSEWGNDFPSAFGQFSISVWCCEQVTLQWPSTGALLGMLTMMPTQCRAEFHAADGTMLFSGTFINPSGTPNLYHIGFSIDTVGHSVMCWGNNVEWTSTDAVFHATGQIGNVP